jgi:hypothetical protein
MSTMLLFELLAARLVEVAAFLEKSKIKSLLPLFGSSWQQQQQRHQQQRYNPSDFLPCFRQTTNMELLQSVAWLLRQACSFQSWQRNLSPPSNPSKKITNSDCSFLPDWIVLPDQAIVFP